MSSKKTVIIILGATAVGKSEVAIKCAKKLNGEIISADSMQIYKELNIGTAKINETEMQGIPHHLINIRNFSESYNVWDFVSDCKKKIAKIHSKKKLPIIVGGTNLYIKALIENYDFENKPKQETLLRVELLNIAEGFGLNKLYEILKILNSEQAEKINLNDTSRILRALECVILQENNKEKIYKVIDNLFKNKDEKLKNTLINLIQKITIQQQNKEDFQENKSQSQTSFGEISEKLTINFSCLKNGNFVEKKEVENQNNDYDFRLYALSLPRDLLYERINKRVDLMLKKGLLDEVKNLKNQGLNLEMQAGKSIGYKEFLKFLDDEISYDFAVEKIKQHSRNYAKRQLTWLRSMKEITWLDALNKNKAVELIVNENKIKD